MHCASCEKHEGCFTEKVHGTAIGDGTSSDFFYVGLEQKWTQVFVSGAYDAVGLSAAVLLCEQITHLAEIHHFGARSGIYVYKIAA